MNTLEIMDAIIMPVVAAVISTIIPFVFKRNNNGKHWKYSGEKSSLERVLNYSAGIIVGEGLFVIAFVLGIDWFEADFNIVFSEIQVKNLYLIWNIILYGFIWLKTKPDDILIIFKKTPRYEERLKKIICKTPVVIFGVMWSSIIYEFATIIIWISVILAIVFYITIISLLQSDNEMKYKYAKFYINNGEIIDYIDIKSMHQKKSWIIAKDTCAEYRFRIEDIRRVEYRN